MLGGIAALFIVRAVRSPLARLVSSIARLAEGDFSHRIAWTSRDELGQLIDAFNEMALKLQSTTVSCGYLQSIVNSMGEALFVVSRSGIIQMANPAAEQLLGYQQGELARDPSSQLPASTARPCGRVTLDCRPASPIN